MTEVRTTPTELDSYYDLDPCTISLLDEVGFVRLHGVLSSETIAAHEPEITAKVVELNTMHLPLEERNTYDRAFLQVANLWRQSRLVRELVHSQRLARIAADLLGVDSVRLYHDQALYKESGGGITPWHADQYYWPLSSDRSITAWIPLQDTPVEMGPLEFAAGSHRFEFGRDLPISDESERALQVALAEQGFVTDMQPYELGDVSYHLGWTFHHAGPNLSATPRRVMTMIYIDAAITAAQPVNEQQQFDLATLMPGVAIGHVPETPLTPVVYTKKQNC